MKRLAKIVKWTLISLGGLIVCLIIAYNIYMRVFYVQEMNQIKKELNKMENVEVINIWGHRDITLEEISARLRIKGKGEIVLCDLNPGDFTYPDHVDIDEIGGFSFTWFSHNGGIGPGIDIGKKGELGHLFEKEFYTPKDVIDNYDLIYETVKNLKMSPEINHFETETSEDYLLIHNEGSIDQDPIFNLLGIENLFEFAETLTWNRDDSYYKELTQ